MNDYNQRADKVMLQINELAAISETAGMISRRYGTAAFVAAGEKIMGWMAAAGLSTAADNMFNIRGRLQSPLPNAKTLVIASHFDSVINAGKFDGPLGILLGLDCMARLAQQSIVLPFNIELLAFCDEEGVRFHTTYLGSKVIAGSFDAGLLHRTDSDGISLQQCIEKLGGDAGRLPADAIKKDNLIGYFEMHIEQGPVLYTSGIPVAVVTAIAGQRRSELIFTGEAGHAGTVPMNMRHDALCCAADCIKEIEAVGLIHTNELVATVGKLHIEHAASNVVPGLVTCSLDIRSADQQVLLAACDELNKRITEICRQRDIGFAWKDIQQTGPVVCDTAMTELLGQSIEVAGYNLVKLVSGAGHDAVPMSAVCPVSMLFIRCFKGISHNPLEDVETKDMAAALRVADHFLLSLIEQFNKG